jgi:hypothetical protein
LQEGKQKFKDNIAMIDGLIRAYAMTNNYQEGFKELLYFVSLTQNLQQAQARLFGFMGSESAVEFIDNAFSRELKRNDHIILLRLYS